VLQRVDGLAVAADQDAELLALDRADQALLVLGHLDLGIQIQRVDDLLQQLAQALGGVLRTLAGHQRRRPDRAFLRRRGGGGGLAPGFPSPSPSEELDPLPPPPFGDTTAGAGAGPPSPPPPPAVAGRNGPTVRLTMNCWRIVQRFVVIQ
jgi:hypothetical protein